MFTDKEEQKLQEPGWLIQSNKQLSTIESEACKMFTLQASGQESLFCNDCCSRMRPFNKVWPLFLFSSLNWQRFAKEAFPQRDGFHQRKCGFPSLKRCHRVTQSADTYSVSLLPFGWDKSGTCIYFLHSAADYQGVNAIIMHLRQRNQITILFV